MGGGKWEEGRGRKGIGGGEGGLRDWGTVGREPFCVPQCAFYMERTWSPVLFDVSCGPCRGRGVGALRQVVWGLGLWDYGMHLMVKIKSKWT